MGNCWLLPRQPATRPACGRCETGAQVGVLQVDNWVPDAEFSPDGRWVATSYGSAAQVWDVASKSRLSQLMQAKDTILVFHFQPQQRVVTHRVARWSGSGVGCADRGRSGQADEANGGHSAEPAGLHSIHQRWQVDPDGVAERGPESSAAGVGGASSGSTHRDWHRTRMADSTGGSGRRRAIGCQRGTAADAFKRGLHAVAKYAAGARRQRSGR